MIYKTLIIDDEEPARIRLRDLLKEHASFITIIGEAANGIEAIQMIQTLNPELIFLDIQMPGKDGFQVLQSLDKVPYVIFCTAYDQYAIQAFETNSIGYLLKPVKSESLDKALNKLQSIDKVNNRADILQMVEEMLIHKQSSTVTSFPVKIGDRVVFIKLEDISFFEAKSKYVEIHTRQGKQFDLDQSLTYLEEKLPASFIRVHRSNIINTHLVKEVRKYMASKFSIVMDDVNQTRIISGRNYLEIIKRMTQI